ncbi:MAG TPA: hypothetical protein VGF46_04130 [Gaiellales bacterium]
MSTTSSAAIGRAAPDRASRLASWTGVAFIVSFVASTVVSSPPRDSVSNARWIASYTGDGNQEQHLATGVLLIVAGLCLAAFLTQIWSMVEARGERRISPLPVVGASIAAACMAVGGALMGVVSGDTLIGSSPLPGADLLRFCNDLGFVMVGVPGMLAVSLTLAILSIQAHAVGLFGTRMRWFTLAVAIILLGSFEFFPIAALLIWVIAAAIALPRGAAARSVAPQARIARAG